MKPFSYAFGSRSYLEKEPMQVYFLSNNNKNKPKKQATDTALGVTTEWYSNQLAVLLAQKKKKFLIPEILETYLYKNYGCIFPFVLFLGFLGGFLVHGNYFKNDILCRAIPISM